MECFIYKKTYTSAHTTHTYTFMHCALHKEAFIELIQQYKIYSICIIN